MHLAQRGAGLQPHVLQGSAGVGLVVGFQETLLRADAEIVRSRCESAEKYLREQSRGPDVIDMDDDAQRIGAGRRRAGRAGGFALDVGDGDIADPETLKRLEGEGLVAFRYLDNNPNGSMNDIAGLRNERGNVVGLMPHPEHAVEPGFGPDTTLAMRSGVDGLKFFTSVIHSLVNA